MSAPTTLHKAVSDTLQKRLDEFVGRGPFGGMSPLERRLFSVLHAIGYADAKPRIDALAPDSKVRLHPQAVRYFKQFGEAYVTQLEASARLVGIPFQRIHFRKP